MRKDQSIWKDRQEQSVFGKSISTLVGIKFGSIFISEDQGGGEVSILVLKGRGVSDNKMKEVKRYIKNSFQLDEKDISLGHGHTKGTIVINLSEISSSSKKIIEEEINNKIILPDRVRKIKDQHQKLSIEKTLPILITSNKIEKLEVIEEIKTEQKQTQTQTQTSVMEKISLIKKGRALFSAFLTTIFRFEGILSNKKDKIFEFENKKKDQDCQNISFRNEAEANMAHKALTWFYGEANDLPILESKDVMVNFFAYDLQIDRPAYISYCFPPIQGEDAERIKKRCIHVLTGYRPSVVEIIDNDSFKVNYLTLATTKKFFGLIQKMDWPAELKDDFIVCKFRNKATSEKKVIAEAPIALVPENKNLGLEKNFISHRSISEKVNEVSNQEEISVKEVKSTLEPAVTKTENKDTSFIPQDEKEVLSELQDLYADKRLFSKLPTKTQKEVFSRIRMNYREEHTLEYTEGLLAFFKK